MKIYVMDSDYEVLKKLESLINGYPKHKAKCFTTIRQLVEAVRSIPPDIVLVDVDTVNGSSAVEAIQAISSDIGIIMMSEDEKKVLEYFRFRANGFLRKPIEEENLREQLFRVEHPVFARIKYGGERR